MANGTRLAWNFLSVEKNPGYYTSSTYYGGGGDILTLAFAAQYQKEGAGTAALPADFFGWSVDLLFEKSFGTNVLTTSPARDSTTRPEWTAKTLAPSRSGCRCRFEAKHEDN